MCPARIANNSEGMAPLKIGQSAQTNAPGWNPKLKIGVWCQENTAYIHENIIIIVYCYLTTCFFFFFLAEMEKSIFMLIYNVVLCWQILRLK